MPDENWTIDDGELRLAAAAVGAGGIALVTLAFEQSTGGVPARLLGFDRGFVSMPLGLAAVVLAVLSIRTNWQTAIPSTAIAGAYWLAVGLLW